ncbi:MULTISPECIES: Imm1 family immunity protein [Streptomyces]|uniref:Imm1 family immunity protein n=1 Tax=Streptomyces caniscabiei TaxID=2746961 RepID=A0ABU4MGQ3_9ACTN|nr:MULTISPECIES: Imm1 family immunity protein [Streptomyces]MDX2940458.1 Imm1 family immunity protein [Streptomyces caniscabiei]MDX2950199.1 Imm1 family immunity protein [Streptomyces caniscabiei]MDX2985381.1 Imm1 family immunity protein [Streptomyces caniscabiei]MDX3007198.1 Imm1 family immunity protein [Streptomyces caniscabiei]MDX3035987.1 Imm1 family immunity protein [Streptomyces caniscabiei]
MILSVSYGSGWHHAETWEEKARLITQVMETLQSEGRTGQWYTPGEDAWFSLSEERHDDSRPVADNYLRVAVNRSTGYGGLVWGVTEDSPRRGGIHNSVWVSDNPLPPAFDPRVVSDPGYPLFHDPCSTLPVPRVRAAVEEFCRTDTGDRPRCVQWVPGHLNGERLDKAPMVDLVENSDPFA